VFEPGDFEKLYNKIINTVQILLRNGVNPEAFRQAFQELMAENPEITGDSIQAIERKGNDVLVTLEVSESIDKGKVERQFLEVYEARLEDAITIAFIKGKLESEQEANTRYDNIFNNFINAFTSNQSSNPILNFTNIAKAENDMSDNPHNFNIDIDQKHANNANAPVATGDNVTQNIENNNVTPEPTQSLPEAAAEIQQLLQQLEKTSGGDKEVVK
ncbi:MAG: pentapeptide repeat-containing protein, partial [Moorea sp. SIO2I5]|nr:pentapeptide repeat-containing protein [Moorena sp. SIO2I5]